MNLRNDDDVCLGNHELDCGMEQLAVLLAMAKLAIVCSNYEVSSSLIAPYVKPYIILENSGLKIGVIGVAPQLEGLVQVEKYEGVIYQDPVGIANKLAAQLKQQEGCDAVICLSQLGLKDDETFIRQTSNIDVVLGGHSHSWMDEPIDHLNDIDEKVSLLHTGRNGVILGELEVTFTQK